jgi:type IV pilus assembly protein PilA
MHPSRRSTRSEALGTHRSRSRGFTMMELLVVMAMVAVLATVATLSFRSFIHASQASEAKAVLGQIRNGEEAYKVEMLQYLSVSGSMTDYYPNLNPNDKRWAWNRPGDSRFYSAGPPITGWQLLNVNPDGPVRFGYVVMAGVCPGALPPPDPSFSHAPSLGCGSIPNGTPWFVAGARNEHVNATFKPSLMLTTSYDGTIYAELEAD